MAQPPVPEVPGCETPLRTAALTADAVHLGETGRRGRPITYAASKLGPLMRRDAARGQRYRLVVAGELGERFASLFEGMQMERGAGRTILTGPVRDQAQLNGFFERIEELGLQLVSVEQLPLDTRDSKGRASAP